MAKIASYIILLIILLLPSFTGFSQPGFYIPANAKIFFAGDTATILFNVINEGKLSIGTKAFINFSARHWSNHPLSLITNEDNLGDSAAGETGVVRFLSADNIRQQLSGGYNAATTQGPSFSHLHIENAEGVELINSTTKIRHHLELTDGHLHLKDHILVVGDGDPGKISGYDTSHYIVTGSASAGSMLLRENISSAHGLVVFPVGSTENAYTPAGIISKAAQGDDYYVNVFDSVKSNLFTGINLQAEGVNKTWQIGKMLQPGTGDADIILQHLSHDEGSSFSVNRQNAYISQYINGGWDSSFPGVYPRENDLTTGTSSPNSNSHIRSFNSTISSASYFTKFATPVNQAKNKTLLALTAFRTDSSQVEVVWATNPEINNKYFVVERRLSNEDIFKPINKSYSKAINGSSFTSLDYRFTDVNTDKGISYYRLILISYGDDSSYSEMVAVGGIPRYHFLVWPNPAPDHFFIGMNGNTGARSIIVTDLSGKILRQEIINGRSIIEMSGLRPGMYMISFLSLSGDIMETKKIVIGGK